MTTNYWNTLLLGAVIGAVIVFAAAMFGILMAVRKTKPRCDEMEALRKRGDELIKAGARLRNSGWKNKEQTEAWDEQYKRWKEDADAFEGKK